MSEYSDTKRAESKADRSATPKARKSLPACATSRTPNVATRTLTASRDVVRSPKKRGHRTASITGLVLTKKVAFAMVVSFTAKMKVAKCRLRNTPDAATSVKSRLPKNRRLRVAEANRIMTKADMKSRRNVSEIAEASVANLMKIALEAKKKEAIRRMTTPLDGSNQKTLAAPSLNRLMDI